MSKLEERNESCDPSCQNVQATQIDQNTDTGKGAEVSHKKHQKASCGFNLTAGIERWGPRLGGLNGQKMMRLPKKVPTVYRRLKHVMS